jgi:predicted nucleic acid-binding protein
MLYLDTSFLVPYFVSEESSEKVERFLRGVKGEELALSAWTATEFVSAIGLKVRTRQLDKPAASAALAAFREVAEAYFNWLAVSQGDFKAASVYLEKWDLGLRAGDALHLAVAKSNGVKKLLTLDERMLNAAKALRIPVSTGIRI